MNQPPNSNGFGGHRYPQHYNQATWPANYAGTTSPRFSNTYPPPHQAAVHPHTISPHPSATYYNYTPPASSYHRGAPPHGYNNNNHSHTRRGGGGGGGGYHTPNSSNHRGRGYHSRSRSGHRTQYNSHYATSSSSHASSRSTEDEQKTQRTTDSHEEGEIHDSNIDQIPMDTSSNTSNTPNVNNSTSQPLMEPSSPNHSHANSTPSHSKPTDSHNPSTSHHHPHSSNPTKHSRHRSSSSTVHHAITPHPHHKSSKNILQADYILSGRYKINKCIGKGRFSHVFSAKDAQHFQREVAVKVDTNPKEKELLLQEYNIMQSLNPSPYICKVFDFNKLPKEIGIGNYLVMELCNEQNLSDQRKECPTKCFGIQKGALIGVEMMLALKSFHAKGYVHRDIKPSNFVLPLKQSWPNHLYIVDFGLSKKFDYALNQTPKEAEFIGTSLYASTTAHNKLDLCPNDDLWSALFVIIDISTNSLPWKEDYVKLENQSKLRRQTVGKLKQEFVDFMLSDVDGTESKSNANSNGDARSFEQRFPFKMPEEYKEIIQKLNACGYGEKPKYDELIRIFRSIAQNEKYKADQYVADHAPETVDRPIHQNFEILSSDGNSSLCTEYVFGRCSHTASSTPCPLGLHPSHEPCTAFPPRRDRQYEAADLCEQYVREGYCQSNRPSGSWCEHGYHWTLNDEMHFRNHGELPLVYIGYDEMCLSIRDGLTCSNATCKYGEDPGHSASDVQPVWNGSRAFSKRKKYWGRQDLCRYREYGQFPVAAVEYKRTDISTGNFADCLHEIVRIKFAYLVENTCFRRNDFMDERLLDELYKLKVSQAVFVFDECHKRSATMTDFDGDQRREFIIECIRNALKIECPHKCKKYSSAERERKEMLKSIKYPALYQKTLDSKFTMKVTRCHPDNDENAKKMILVRLEEFARHVRHKNLGPDVVNLLCSIPFKYAIDVLDEVQKMGDKIAVVQSMITKIIRSKEGQIKRDYKSPGSASSNSSSSSSASSSSSSSSSQHPSHFASNNAPPHKLSRSQSNISPSSQRTETTKPPPRSKPKPAGKPESLHIDFLSRYEQQMASTHTNHSGQHLQSAANPIINTLATDTKLIRTPSASSLQSDTDRDSDVKMKPSTIPKRAFTAKSPNLEHNSSASPVEDESNLMYIPKRKSFANATNNPPRSITKPTAMRPTLTNATPHAPSPTKRKKKRRSPALRKPGKKSSKKDRKHKSKKQTKKVTFGENRTFQIAASQDDDEDDDIICKTRNNRKRRRTLEDSDEDDEEEDDADTEMANTQSTGKSPSSKRSSSSSAMSVDSEDDSEESSDDSSDDVPIGQKSVLHGASPKKSKKRKHEEMGDGMQPKQKKRKINRRRSIIGDSSEEEEEDESGDDDDEYNPFQPRSTRGCAKNVSYKEVEEEEDIPDPVEPETFEKMEFKTHGLPGISQPVSFGILLKQSFQQIFGVSNTNNATRSMQRSQDKQTGIMTKEQCISLRQDVQITSRKEAERDVAIELVRKHKPKYHDAGLAAQEFPKCSKCHKDPKHSEWELLLCDFCSSGAAHCSCCDPPYCAVPEKDWACPQCTDQVKKEHRDEFEKLLQQKLASLERKWKANEAALKRKKETLRKKQMQREAAASTPPPAVQNLTTQPLPTEVAVEKSKPASQAFSHPHPHQTEPIQSAPPSAETQPKPNNTPPTEHVNEGHEINVSQKQKLQIQDLLHKGAKRGRGRSKQNEYTYDENMVQPMLAGQSAQASPTKMDDCNANNNHPNHSNSGSMNASMPPLGMHGSMAPMVASFPSFGMNPSMNFHAAGSYVYPSASCQPLPPSVQPSPQQMQFNGMASNSNVVNKCDPQYIANVSAQNLDNNTNPSVTTTSSGIANLTAQTIPDGNDNTNNTNVSNKPSSTSSSNVTINNIASIQAENVLIYPPMVNMPAYCGNSVANPSMAFDDNVFRSFLDMTKPTMGQQQNHNGGPQAQQYSNMNMNPPSSQYQHFTYNFSQPMNQNDINKMGMSNMPNHSMNHHANTNPSNQSNQYGC